MTDQVNEDKRTNKIVVNPHDKVIVDKLRSDIDSGRGNLHDNERDIHIIGHTYAVILNREFEANFENETKFENDYKFEANGFPMTTRSYFINAEIERFKLIDNTIKKCFPDSTYYRTFPQYVGMCGYLEFLENYKPQNETQSNFDADDKTNPLIFEVQLLVDLHRDFSNYLWNTIDIDNFKNCFRKTPLRLVFNEGVTLAEICYLFGKIEKKQVGVSNFPNWMKNHIGENNYGKNKKELERIVMNVSDRKNDILTATIPQQKALENKQKIDDLFNRMHSN